MKNAKLLLYLLVVLAGQMVGQTWDTSGDKLLKGPYFFRQIVWIPSSDGLKLGEAASLSGNIVFDGTGNYTVSGTLVSMTTAAPKAYSATGTYSIAASGHGFISSPVGSYLGALFNTANSDSIYGLVSQGIFIGSATENTYGYNDLFIAAPQASFAASNATLTGNYVIADLDHPTGNPLDARGALFKFTASGDGSLSSLSFTARSGITGEGVSQAIANLPYSFSNGVGSFDTRGIIADSILVQGTYNLYISPDGDFVFGGASNGWDMFVGVRSATLPNPNFNGIYYQGGMDLDFSAIASGVTSATSYFGSLDAFTSGNQGFALEHQRRSSKARPVYDYTFVHPYSFNSDRTIDDARLGQHYVFSSSGNLRIGLAQAPYLGINLALQSPAFHGSGVAIDPRGITNSGSSSLFTSRIAPGELITIYGSSGASFVPESRSDFTFPLTLGGVVVLINNRLAPILSLDATYSSVTVMVPYETTEPIASIQVAYNGVSSNTVTVFTGDTAPGVFTLPPGGVSRAAARHANDASVVSQTNPAQVGEIISVYLTGLGQVSPPVSTGAVGPSDPLSWAAHDIQVFIDGVPAPTPQFVGLTPTVVGLGVINVQIPAGVRVGQDVYLDVRGPDSYTSQATVSIKASTGTAVVSALAGNNQSATINTGFPARLIVQVKDATGNPVSGTTVTFTPPGIGASVNFAGGINIAITDSSGIAASALFTANGLAGGYTVSATSSGAAPAIFTLTNVPRLPASIAALGGTPQSAAVNTTFSQRLTATVKDSAGNPVTGALVTFSTPASGASGIFAISNRALTNSLGVATANAFTASGIAGSYTVTASVVGAPTSASFVLTNTANTSSISIVSGAGQSTAVNTPFAAPLVVTVKDSAGNPSAGVTVTFTAPSSGASGTFAAGLTTASTNALGVATSAIFTANGIAGDFTVTASAPGAAVPASFTLTNTGGTSGSITATSGTPQSAPINTAFTLRLTATVKNASGTPISGVIVTFAAPASGASGTFAGGVNTAATNAAGIATSPVFTANGTPGSYIVTATTPGISAPANFSLTNTGGTAASVQPVTGTPQVAAVGTAFAAPFVVIVRDAAGNPLSGVTVTFAAPSTGASGTFAGSTAIVTNASGLATSPVFTANSTAGSYTVSASVAGVSAPANFSVTNTVGTPSSIVASSGTPQSAVINTAFAAPLVTLLKDSAGNPLSGTVVTFSAPIAGASGTFPGGATSTATTNASGLATSAVFTANGITGTYTVAAVAAGVATAANFTLTNTAGRPASIVATSGTPQSTAINTAFPARLVATVTDSAGNPVSGAVVTFVTPSSGAGGTFAGGTNTATTNASGAATSGVFTANANAGSYAVTASVTGMAATASFALTNSGSPSSIVAVGGTPQTAQINTSFAAQFVAAVKDSAGNPVSGALVTFTAPGSGASGTFVGGANTATTNAAGLATSAVFRANSIAGSYSVTALVSGVLAPANFSLTNSPASGGGGIVVTAASVGQNLETTINLTLPQPAPTGGVQVTVTTADPSKLVLSGRAGDPGTSSLALSVGEGLTTITGIFVQGLVSSGSVSVTASAPGYTDGAATMTLTPSAFVIAGPGGIGAALTANQGSTTTLTVSTVQLDAAFHIVQTQQLRGGFSTSVGVTSSTPSVGAITNSPLPFNGGDLTATTQFSAVSPGSTTVSVDVPTGFTTPAQGKNLAASVNPVGLSAGSVTVGNNLQTTAQVALIGTAPPEGLSITLTSNNASQFLLSKTPTGSGSASIIVTVLPSLSVSPVFYVQGLANSGGGTYTAVAPGFGSSTGTVTLAPSGFVIAGPFGFGQPTFFTTTGSGSQTFTVYSVLLDSSLNFVSQMALAPGASANVTVNSSSGLVASITSPVAIPGGSVSGTATLQPLNSGITNVSVVQPSGFSVPTQGTSIAVTISTPGIALTDGAAIGFNLEIPATVGLGAPAPAGGVLVTLTSNSSQLRLSPTGSSAGSASITVNIPEGSTSTSFYLQGLASSGSATYTASAPGYSNRTGTIVLAPSGPVLAGPFGVGTSFFQASAAGANVPITVYMAQLDPSTHNFVNVQSLAGGQTLSFSLNSTSPAVGTIVTPVTLTGGSTSSSGIISQFDPVSQGSAIVSVATPAGGYTTSNNFASLTAQVGP